MDAFDAVGGAIDGLWLLSLRYALCRHGCRFSSMPPDMGAFMDGYPPYGDFPGGEAFDPGAMPDTWEPGPMTDMGPNQDMGVIQDLGPNQDISNQYQSRFRTKPRYGTE